MTAAEQINGCPLLSSQIALFLAAGADFRILAVANAVGSAFSQLFQAEPSLVPLPADAPGEIPRVLLQQPGVGSLAVGTLRADLTLEWKAGDEHEWQGLVVRRAVELAGVFETLGMSITRLGLVLVYDLADGISLEEIRRRYMCRGKAEGALALDLAWLRRISSEGTNVNRWVRLSYGLPEGENRRLIIDTNTVQGEGSLLTPADVGRLLQSWIAGIGGDLSHVVDW